MDSYIVDHCDECSEYGDDWYVDDNGEMVSACWVVHSVPMIRMKTEKGKNAQQGVVR